jgi:hypothetical protein
MNLSYFFVWDRIRPILLEAWSLMLISFEEKVGWETRLRQALLWAAACMPFSLPLMHLCLFFGELTENVFIQILMGLVALIIACIGFVSFLIILITIPTLIVCAALRGFQKV